jgi:hypothetical protein
MPKKMTFFGKGSFEDRTHIPWWKFFCKGNITKFDIETEISGGEISGRISNEADSYGQKFPDSKINGMISGKKIIFVKEYFDMEHARIIYELKKDRCCPTIWRGTFRVLQRKIDFVDDWGAYIVAYGNVLITNTACAMSHNE